MPHNENPDSTLAGGIGEAEVEREQPTSTPPRRSRRQRLSWQHYAKLINLAWRKNTKAIIEVAAILNAARNGLGNGAWGEMFASGRIPFTADFAQRLMKIAGDPVISNPVNLRFLPGRVEALYPLTRMDSRLGPGTLQAKIDDRSINSRTTIKEIRGMIPYRRRVRPDTEDPMFEFRHELGVFLNSLENFDPTGRYLALMEFKRAINERYNIIVTIDHIPNVDDPQPQPTFN